MFASVGEMMPPCGVPASGGSIAKAIKVPW
jgi:hypothetical protein